MKIFRLKYTKGKRGFSRIECGKSTAGKSIIKLNDITSGEILYEKLLIYKRFVKRKDLLKFNKKDTVNFFKTHMRL